MVSLSLRGKLDGERGGRVGGVALVHHIDGARDDGDGVPVRWHCCAPALPAGSLQLLTGYGSG